MVIREESQQNVASQRETKQEASAFHVSGKTQSAKGGTRDNQRPICGHCQKIGHEKSQWFEVTCYPANWNTRRSGAKGYGRGRSNLGGGTARASHVASINTQSVQDSTENQTEVQIAGFTMKINQLFNIFKEKQQQDQISTQLSGKANFNNCWLIDSGASHHMTPHKSLLRNIYKLHPTIDILAQWR